MSELLVSCVEFEQLSNANLYEILQLRSAVFVVEQDCVFQDMDGLDAQSLHVLGKTDGRLVAYARLLPATLKYDGVSIGRVVTDAQVRRFGYGRQLMAAAIEQCRQRWPEHPIVISAQQYLEKFYQGFGFVTVSAPYLEDGIYHLEMRLEAANSPA